MRSRLSRDFRLLAVVVSVALAAVALALAGSLSAATDSRAAAEAWKSAFERRSPLPSDGRMIVVLAGPSLAERVERQGPMSPRAERRFVKRAEAFQRRLLSSLRVQGVKIKPLYSYTRIFNGFAAALDARAVAALERSPGVVGIYPVRTVYPASVSEVALDSSGAGDDTSRSRLSVPGFDGSGITIAVLDTGVDSSHPALAGKVLPGVDLVDRYSAALPRKSPESGQLETHGTRMAAIVAGAAGPGGVGGVAPGASILPIRVLGWERSEGGGYEVLGRADTLLAGLERAVDPNRNGDVRDAARIALAAIVEPYASFSDSPESRAVAGARALGTLVVAAAGNDGPAGTGFGTIGAPGGAPSALTVGAADTRPELPSARVTVSVGGTSVYSKTTRSLGAVVPATGIDLLAVTLNGPTLSDPSRRATATAGGNARGDFLDLAGTSLVRGKAVVVPGDGASLATKVRNAAAAGALAVLVYGSGLPAGGLDLEESSSIPVVAIPTAVGRRIVDGRARGWEVKVTISSDARIPNGDAGRVAAFSSEGPAFDGSVKPDLVAPGVAIPTADAGTAADGTARYATVTGSSAAAATVAGAAALVAQARPDFEASELAEVLTGTATPLAVDGRPQPVTLQGAGLVDASAAAAAGVVVEAGPTVTGEAANGSWSSQRTLHVGNVSDARISVDFGFVLASDTSAPLTLTADPGSLDLRPGASRDVLLSISALVAPENGVAGTIVVTGGSAGTARVPWAVTTGQVRSSRLVSRLAISQSAFAPSLEHPAVVTFRAGRIVSGPNGVSIEPVALLEVELRTLKGKRLGVLTRLRDVLPGTYSIGLTGRGPDGRLLAAGRYEIVVRALGVTAREGAKGGASASSVGFTVRRPDR